MNLDTSVFSVLSAASENDRTSFLRLQQVIRTHVQPYTYLEIGSEIGGTLVPYLLDDTCKSAVSIDLRPLEVPDERGVVFDYGTANTTARMLDTLTKAVGSVPLRKLTCLVCDASSVRVDQLPARPQFAMIDGEHTNTACFSDVISLLPLIADDAVIAFHDANLICDAIENAEKMLTHIGIEHATVFLPDCVAAIGLRGMANVVRSELSPFALERTAYLAKSRHDRIDTMIYMRQNPSKAWRSI